MWKVTFEPLWYLRVQLLVLLGLWLHDKTLQLGRKRDPCVQSESKLGPWVSTCPDVPFMKYLESSLFHRLLIPWFIDSIIPKMNNHLQGGYELLPHPLTAPEGAFSSEMVPWQNLWVTRQTKVWEVWHWFQSPPFHTLHKESVLWRPRISPHSPPRFSS